MGRKNKAYRLSLHQQIYNRLTSMQAFGESKQQGMQTEQCRIKYTVTVHIKAIPELVSLLVNTLIKIIRKQLP